MEWTEYIPLVGGLLIALLGVAAVVVKFTPTTKDDEIVSQITAVVEKLVAKEKDSETGS